MRLVAVCFVLLAGCASADPGYGPTSPTRPQAPSAEAPAIATALEDDPAPEPEGPDDGGQHAHHGGHGMPANESADESAGEAAERDPEAHDAH